MVASVIAADPLKSFQHNHRVSTDDLNYVSNGHVGYGRGSAVRTTMPSLTFSPPSFSSTASSRTMFKKTWMVLAVGAMSEMSGTYIVATKNTDDLTAAVQLDEQPLVKVLWK